MKQLVTCALLLIACSSKKEPPPRSAEELATLKATARARAEELRDAMCACADLTCAERIEAQSRADVVASVKAANAGTLTEFADDAWFARQGELIAEYSACEDRASFTQFKDQMPPECFAYGQQRYRFTACAALSKAKRDWIAESYDRHTSEWNARPRTDWPAMAAACEAAADTDRRTVAGVCP